jgi:hypothetical protein
MVYACSLAFQGMTILLGGILDEKMGTRCVCFVGGYILVAGTFFSANATSLSELILTDGVMFGIGLGN